jgi:hypothetical protein
LTQNRFGNSGSRAATSGDALVVAVPGEDPEGVGEFALRCPEVKLAASI